MALTWSSSSLRNLQKISGNFYRFDQTLTGAREFVRAPIETRSGALESYFREEHNGVLQTAIRAL